jgi:hypothetical protein
MRLSLAKKVREGGSRYQIEKGIPLPGNLNGRASVYPFPQMEVGDSFAFEPDRYNTVRRAATYWGGDHGVKFSVSTIHNRCWRRS